VEQARAGQGQGARGVVLDGAARAAAWMAGSGSGSRAASGPARRRHWATGCAAERAGEREREGGGGCRKNRGRAATGRRVVAG
jgi:hypothetical protein